MRLMRFAVSYVFGCLCALLTAGGCYWRPPPGFYIPPPVYYNNGGYIPTLVYPTYYDTSGRPVYMSPGVLNVAPIYRPPPVYVNPGLGGGGGWRGGWGGGWRGHRFR